MKRGEFCYIMVDTQIALALVTVIWQLYRNCNFIKLDETTGKRKLRLINRLFGTEQASCQQIPIRRFFLIKNLNFLGSENSRPIGGSKPAKLFGINPYADRPQLHIRHPYNSGCESARVCNRTHALLRPQGFTVYASPDIGGWLPKAQQALLRQHSASDKLFLTRQASVAAILPFCSFGS